MILKTLGECEWKDIEVGEVFAIYKYFCQEWQIEYKIKSTYKESCLQLEGVYNSGNITFSPTCSTYALYKLPLSVQRLWRQD